MDRSRLAEKARRYIETLTGVEPNRRTGSEGNREASRFFAETICPYVDTVDHRPFETLDYSCEEVQLSHNGDEFDVQVSPYSPPCDVNAELLTVSTVEELRKISCRKKLLLMAGEICSQQLMPKNFPFFNPEEHREIISLLEEKKPAGLITATEKMPMQVGALDPCPLIVDGDFNIPSVYCSQWTGQKIKNWAGETFRMKIDSERREATAANVVARFNKQSTNKIVVTAHIDAYEDSPGALDNASVVAVLLLLAEILDERDSEVPVEIAALNGEDHYSVGGQLHYLEHRGEQLNNTKLAVNIDYVGHRGSRIAYSFYECPERLEEQIRVSFNGDEELVAGEGWMAGDHMMFVQNGVPALAFTSDNLPELMANIAHTEADTPEKVDKERLVTLAEIIADLVEKLQM